MQFQYSSWAREILILPLSFIFDFLPLNHLSSIVDENTSSTKSWLNQIDSWSSLELNSDRQPKNQSIDSQLNLSLTLLQRVSLIETLCIPCKHQIVFASLFSFSNSYNTIFSFSTKYQMVWDALKPSPKSRKGDPDDSMGCCGLSRAPALCSLVATSLRTTGYFAHQYRNLVFFQAKQILREPRFFRRYLEHTDFG